MLNVSHPDRATQAILSRAHSTTATTRKKSGKFPNARSISINKKEPTVPEVANAAGANLVEQIMTIQNLAQVASQYPYYKFNYAWNRQIEASV